METITQFWLGTANNTPAPTTNATENNKNTEISKQSYGVNACLGTTCNNNNLRISLVPGKQFPDK